MKIGWSFFGWCVAATLATTLTLMGTEQSPQTRPVEGLRTAPPNVFALKGGQVVTSVEHEPQLLTVIVRGGRIEKLLASDAPLPEDAKVIDVAGKWIYPGLVDPFVETEVAPPAVDRGIPYWNDQVVPERRAVDGFLRDAAAFEKLRKQGFTTIAIVPNDRIVKGSSSVVTTSDEELIQTLLLPEWAQHIRLTVSGGFGARGGGYPSSPMGAVALARQAMLDAQWYQQAWEVYNANPTSEQPEQSGALAALAESLKNRQPFVIDGLNELFVLRADDFAREFGLNLIVRGSGREYTRLDAIAKFQRPILVPVNFPKAPNVATPDEAANAELGSLMHWELAPENAGRLHAAGVTIALTSFGLQDGEDFLANVRKAVKRGLPKTAALKAMTITPAELLGVYDVVGSVAPGKWANLLITDQELFEGKCKIEETWVQGKRFAWKKAQELDLSGDWKLALQPADGKPSELTLKLSHSAERLSGSIANPALAAVAVAEAPKGESVAAPDMNATPPAPADTAKEAEAINASEVNKASEVKPEKKENEAKLDRASIKDRILNATFESKSVVPESTGSAQLTLTIIDTADGNKLLIGSLVWNDGTVVTVRGVSTVAAKPEATEAKKEEGKQVDGKPTEGKREDSQKSEEVFSKLAYPLASHGVAEKPATPEWLLVKNATIWTSASAGILSSSDLLVHQGKIHSVGQGLVAPEGATIIDATGMHLSAGIIDCHSHMATDGGVNESAQAVTAEVRIGDFIDCNDNTIYLQLAGGVTAANILHGSANPIGGQNQVIKLRWGSLPNEMKLDGAPAGIKFALGENVKRSNSQGLQQGPARYPATRMGVEQILRDQFEAAVEYRKAWQVWKETGRGLPPRRDLQSDAILEIVEGKRWIHCHSYRQDEILAFLRVLESYNVKVGSLQHILEGYKVAEVLAAHGATASSFSDWWAYKFEVLDAIPYNGVLLHRAGVPVSFNSDDNELARHLNHEAAKAVKYGGVPEAEAIKFVTLNPAKQLRIDHMVGSIEPGKDADFVLWSGSPLSTMSRCEQTWVDGKKYFDRQGDMEKRQTEKALRTKLVQKILSGGSEMMAAGEREVNPAGLWPRIDIFCKAKGQDLSQWQTQSEGAR